MYYVQWSYKVNMNEECELKGKPHCVCKIVLCWLLALIDLKKVGDQKQTFY